MFAWYSLSGDSTPHSAVGAGSSSGGGELIVVHVLPCKITASVSVPCTAPVTTAPYSGTKAPVTTAPYIGTEDKFIHLCTFHLLMVLPCQYHIQSHHAVSVNCVLTNVIS